LFTIFCDTGDKNGKEDKMGNLGIWEILLILLVLLLLFGAKRLPELAKGLGKSLREFKKATKDIQDEIDDTINTDKQIESMKSRLHEEKKKSTDKEESKAGKTKE